MNRRMSDRFVSETGSVAIYVLFVTLIVGLLELVVRLVIDVDDHELLSRMLAIRWRKPLRAVEPVVALAVEEALGRKDAEEGHHHEAAEVLHGQLPRLALLGGAEFGQQSEHD